jgi:hypothetical protein
MTNKTRMTIPFLPDRAQVCHESAQFQMIFANLLENSRKSL